ncbi:MAG: AAA family ATPase [Planctomycetota bacterium]|jgi:DNA repair exonuclease SbcCD ATPase subunit
MIIKRIVAENLLKYRRLEITDIPQSGQIAVVGDNEAGKTAVGESICFALFGRTFSLGINDNSRVVRWGEFSGKVLLEFTGKDGAVYAVTRQIDNNGKHQATLHCAGAPEPVADGVEEVDAVIGEVAGFTYQSFVDSFYLAQREMEVPHAKSATVKALIGVDRLEAVSAEFQSEMTEIIASARTLESQIESCRSSIAQVKLDPANLGRLEARRDSEMEKAAVKEKRVDMLSRKAEQVALATKSFARSTEMFVKSTLRHTYSEWRDKREKVSAGLLAASKVSRENGEQVDGQSLKAAGAAILSFEDGLNEFGKVRDLAGLYRHRLRYLLDEKVSERLEVPQELQMESATQERFAEQRAGTLLKIDETQRRRKPMFGAAIFFIEVALAGWIAWALLLGAPESTIAGWLKSVLAMSDTARQVVCLLTGLIGSVLTTMFFAKYFKANRRLQELDLQLENIESAAQMAREEVSVIENIDLAPIPDALNALEHLQNPLLRSAVTAFSDGSGAVFVHPDALDQKLEDVRKNSTSGLRALKESKDRMVREVESLKAEALRHHETIAELEQKIEEEKHRWSQVEALERELGNLEAHANDLRMDQRVRSVGCELVDGACRRIYARFHPELRRFVSKILPELTAGRYEHLELDDDLRVRVYCKEKNDFVGLAEISNGTHRQLMLCVRLALSQALIATTSKTDQFIFFDEPFVFFDEQRMTRSIDVLGKISPQITQVWLAAQTFQNRSRFDMVIDCAPDKDTLIVAGKKSRKSTRHVAAAVTK